MKARRAFTLVELIIALVLSTFVLVGILGVTSQMLRYEFESSRKSSSTNWSLMSLDMMKREVQQGSTLVTPIAGTPSTVLSGCIDWTTNMSLYATPPCVAGSGCPLDGVAANVVSFYYCVWPAGSTPSLTPWLLHYKGTTCPINPTPTCGAGTFDVVAQDFYLDEGAAAYFTRDNDINGVQAKFMVGIGTTNVAGQRNSAVPTAQHINVKISMQKAYGNTSD
jgi:type II secretory pathway pseudopilin PulG